MLTPPGKRGKMNDKEGQHPTSIRLRPEHLAVIERIRNVYSPPGVRLSASEAVKIALKFWETHRDREDEKTREARAIGQ